MIIETLQHSDTETLVFATNRFTPILAKEIIPLPLKAFNQALTKWKNGEYIQQAFPTLNASQREFIKTGLTQQQWDAIFGKEE